MSKLNSSNRNQIEEILHNGKEGKLSLGKMIELLLNERFIIPSISKIDENGDGFLPIIFDRNGLSMAAIFTNEKFLNSYSSSVGDIVLAPLREIIMRLPNGYGLVINPGYEEGLELLETGIHNIKRDFSL